MTDEDLRDAWDDGLTEREIADGFGVPLAEVQHRRRRVLRLRRRKTGWLPTPQEIEEAAARIRAGWSETVRESRRVGERPTWTLPVVPAPDEMPDPE